MVSLLRSCRQCKVVGEAREGLDALQKARELKPQVILISISMPKCDGIESTRLITAEIPGAKVVILTFSDDDLFAAIKAGARGYLLKTCDYSELVHSIVAVAEGEMPFSPRLASHLLSEFASLAEREGGHPRGIFSSALNEQETEILRLIAGGSSDKEIARALSISDATVKTRLRSIMSKLHVQNRAQAAAYAIRTGLDRREPNKRRTDYA